MATVSTIAVNVTANTGKFSKGLNKASGDANKFGKSVGGGGGGGGGGMGAAGALGKFIPVMTLATAAAAAGAIAYRELGAAFDRIDQYAKLASRLGITSQSFRALSFSAELAGSSMEDVNDVLKTMQKNLGDAVMGSGEAVASLNVLGLSAENLAAMDADESFLTIADAIAKIENPALQAALAAKIFGEGSQKMMDVIKGGSEAIREQEADLIHLQGTLSAQDKAEVARMEDAWLRVTKAVEGLWEQIAVMLAPALKMIGHGLAEVIGWVANMVQWFRELDSSWTGLIFLASPLLGAIKFIADAFRDEEEVVKKITEAEKKLALEQFARAEAEQKAVEAALKAREELEKRGVKLLESMRTPMERYNDTIMDLNMMLKEGVINWQTYGRAVEKAQEDIKKSEEFAAKEIKVGERQAVGAAVRGQTGVFSIQQKQQRVLEKIRAEEKLQLEQLKQQTHLLQLLNTNIHSAPVVGI